MSYPKSIRHNIFLEFSEENRKKKKKREKGCGRRKKKGKEIVPYKITRRKTPYTMFSYIVRGP